MVTTSGAMAEGVAVFDPLGAMSAADVTWFDFSTVTVQWAPGTENSQGIDVSGQPLTVSYTSDALVSGGKLMISTSNLDANFDYNPGAVVAYDYDPATNSLSGGAFVQTSEFNPTGLTPMNTPFGQLVLVTNTGSSSSHSFWECTVSSSG